MGRTLEPYKNLSVKKREEKELKCVVQLMALSYTCERQHQQELLHRLQNHRLYLCRRLVPVQGVQSEKKAQKKNKKCFSSLEVILINKYKVFVQKEDE